MIIINAMDELITEPKQVVIREGDKGECLYLVGSGTLQCTKKFENKPTPTFLQTYQPGNIFGELALLYNTPRQATIIANDECQLWVLDRATFNHILKDEAFKKR
jgi:cAMP-dependent protein kinase regulator